jgi:hypothetical protein
MTFKTIDEIQRDREERQRQEMKDKIATDTADIYEKIKKNIQAKKEPKKRSKLLRWLLFILSVAISFFIINFILFNVWAFKWLIKSIFG